MVEGLSDSLAADSNDKEPWEQRKREYIDRLRSEAADVRLISAADKLYNARSILEDYRLIGPEIWRRFKRSRDHADLVLRSHPGRVQIIGTEPNR